MGITLGSSRRVRDQNDPETGLQEALVTGASGRQETRQNLSIGALDPRVMETDHPAVLSTEVPALHVMETGIPAVLSIGALDLHVMETEVPDLHAMEIGTLLTKALIDQPKATASNTMMYQSRYRTLAQRATGCMVSTLS